MKVLHVYRTYFPVTQGGLEEVIRQICKNTKELGVESRVFALADDPGETNSLTAEQPDVAARLAQKLDQMRKQTQALPTSKNNEFTGEFKKW